VDETAIAQRRRTRRRRQIWTLSSLGAALVVVLVLVAAAMPFRAETLRQRIIDTLSDRLDSDVSLGELHLRIFPRMYAVGNDLIIRQRGRADAPPLISVKRFEVEADLAGLLRKRVTHVKLEGLDIEIPPGGHHDDEPADADTVATSGTAATAAADADMFDSIADGVVISAMDSRDARLALVSSKAGKPAKVWAIHTLHLESVGVGRSMPFRATLTNGIPKGEIDTKGSFGPWHRDEPGDTPLNGAYTFDKADLSIFKGISGMLSSKGSFQGTLDRIDATGETDTPDFTVRLSGHPVPLHTKFHSVIDGTNGDTILERIDASFLDSSLVAKGAVVDDSPGVHGRSVKLDIDMQEARIEDLMRLSVKSERAPMTGALTLQTTFLLPPGETDVADRLQLDGRFSIASARFTDYDVQGKIEELSARGRGQTAAAAHDRVVSGFSGQFKLGGGVLRLPALEFQVPGAGVRLAGAYTLSPETLDFKGKLLLDAKLSETQTGLKSVLLKVVDPLFKQKDGSGSVLPIKITGRRDAPEFGLDLGKVLKKDH
jgi:hypothetical protein